MFQKIAKHRANDASNDVHRPPLGGWHTTRAYPRLLVHDRIQLGVHTCAFVYVPVGRYFSTWLHTRGCFYMIAYNRVFILGFLCEYLWVCAFVHDYIHGCLYVIAYNLKFLRVFFELWTLKCLCFTFIQVSENYHIDRLTPENRCTTKERVTHNTLGLRVDKRLSCQSICTWQG